MADYNGVLVDLRMRRDAVAREIRELDIAIAAIERLSPASAGASSVVPAVALARGTLSGLTLPVACEKYMRMAQAGQSTKQVEEALRAGGVPANAKSFPNQVYNALNRLAQPGGPLKRENNRWVLRGEPSSVGQAALLHDTH